MKKTDKISVINTFFNVEKTINILAEGGISAKKVSLLSKRVNKEDIKANYVEGVYKAIQTITKALENWDETMALVSKDLWDYYKLMDFDNFETRQRKVAVKIIKDSWKALPNYRKAEHVKRK